MARLLAALAVVMPLATLAPPGPAETRPVEPLTLGDAKVWALRDGEFSLEASLLAHIAPEEAKALLGGKDAAVTPVNAFLVQVRAKTVLVDTGAGRQPDEDTGHLLERLAAAGVAPGEVDLVVVTHFHLDHLGGLMGPEATRVFPYATLAVPRAERDFWLADPSKLPERLRDRAPRFKALFAAFEAAGRFRTFDAGEELAPGVRTIPAYGHTGGHTVYAFGAPSHELWCIGDLIHFGAVQLEHPEAGVSFDADGARAVAVRKELFRRAAETKVVLAGSHLPQLVRLEAKGEGYAARPVGPPPLP